MMVLDPEEVLRYDIIPFDGEMCMQNAEDGGYVTWEAYERLLELYRMSQRAVTRGLEQME